MERMAGIDFGEKRVGVALSDELGRFALPYGTLERRSDRQVIAELAQIFEQERIHAVAIGEPLRADGGVTEIARRVRGFARKLERTLAVKVVLVVETLTSVEARERLRAAGVDLRREPGRIDAVAAQIILEEALDRRATRREEE
jgi:putative Holliday junction resolvase